MNELTTYQIHTSLKHRLHINLVEYRALLIRYKNNSHNWKKEETFEQYWKQMNKLEEIIDDIFSFCEMYNVANIEKKKNSYNELLNTREKLILGM